MLALVLALALTPKPPVKLSHDWTASYMVCIGKDACLEQYSCQVSVTDWKDLDELSMSDARSALRTIESAERVCGPNRTREKVIHRLQSNLTKGIRKAS